MALNTHQGKERTMKMRHVLTTVLVLSATVAVAHTGVKNAAVKARLERMSAIADKVQALDTVASDLAASMQTEKDVQAAMVPLGARCKACHSLYRE